MPKKEITYQQAIKEIEEILSKIENEELDVDDLTVKVKRVASLIKACKDKLHTTEQEVNKILKEVDNNSQNNSPSASMNTEDE